MKPMEIESASLAIIEQELNENFDLSKIDFCASKLEAELLKRVIHATADFSFAESLCASKDAVALAQDLLSKPGQILVADTNMIKMGVSKPALSALGHELHCFMADEDVAQEAKKRSQTRAWISMEKALNKYDNAIYVIGNAPTAIYSLLDQLNNLKTKHKPALIIGVPVGFVQVVEAKEALMASSIPYIVSRGRKGGSTVAVALMNALLYSLYKRDV